MDRKDKGGARERGRRSHSPATSAHEGSPSNGCTDTRAPSAMRGRETSDNGEKRAVVTEAPQYAGPGGGVVFMAKLVAGRVPPSHSRRMPMRRPRTPYQHGRRLLMRGLYWEWRGGCAPRRGYDASPPRRRKRVKAAAPLEWSTFCHLPLHSIPTNPPPFSHQPVAGPQHGKCQSDVVTARRSRRTPLDTCPAEPAPPCATGRAAGGPRQCSVYMTCLQRDGCVVAQLVVGFLRSGTAGGGQQPALVQRGRLQATAATERRWHDPWSSVHGFKMNSDEMRDGGTCHDGSCTPRVMLLDDVATTQIQLGERTMTT